jgi:hypothetical protein
MYVMYSVIVCILCMFVYYVFGYDCILCKLQGYLRFCILRCDSCTLCTGVFSVGHFPVGPVIRVFWLGLGCCYFVFDIRGRF